MFEPIVGRADHPSTRRAALATAWALPVLAVATPVPAIAASISELRAMADDERLARRIERYR